MSGSRIAFALVVLAAVACIAGCARSVRVEFQTARPHLEEAARIVLASRSAAVTTTVETIPLRPTFSWLAVDGEVWYVREAGHSYLFFPQNVEEPCYYYGFMYSPDGTEPIDQFYSRPDRLAPRWWRGELSERLLAGQPPAEQAHPADADTRVADEVQ